MRKKTSTVILKKKKKKTAFSGDGSKGDGSKGDGSSGAAGRAHGCKSRADPESGSAGGSGRAGAPAPPGAAPRAQTSCCASFGAAPRGSRRHPDISHPGESPKSWCRSAQEDPQFRSAPAPESPARLSVAYPHKSQRLSGAHTAPRPPSRYRLSRRPPARHPLPPHSPPPAGAPGGAVPVPCEGAHPGDDGSAPRGQQRQQQQQRSSAQAPHAAGPRPPALPAGAARWSRPGAAPAVIKLGAAVPRRESPPPWQRRGTPCAPLRGAGARRGGTRGRLGTARGTSGGRAAGCPATAEGHPRRHRSVGPGEMSRSNRGQLQGASYCK